MKRAVRYRVNLEMLAKIRPHDDFPLDEECILDSGGCEVGKFTWALLHDEKDFINWRKHPFLEYRKKISLREIWPMAFLDNLEIRESSRNKGFAKSAVGRFLKLAKKRKAACAFLRVGNGPGDQLDKNLHIYRSHGFVLLERKEGENYFMYRDLKSVQFSVGDRTDPSKGSG